MDKSEREAWENWRLLFAIGSQARVRALNLSRDNESEKKKIMMRFLIF